jgi:hypothetical protein
VAVLDTRSELRAAPALVLDDSAAFHVGVFVDIECKDNVPVIQGGGVPGFVSNNPIGCVCEIVALDDALHVNGRRRVIGIVNGDLVCAGGNDARCEEGQRQEGRAPGSESLEHLHALHSR